MAVGGRGWRADVDEIHLQSVRTTNALACERGREGGREGGERYRKFPSVRTLRSWRMNHIPTALSGSVSLNALTPRLPIKFRVNMPGGVGVEAVGSVAVRGSCCASARLV